MAVFSPPVVLVNMANDPTAVLAPGGVAEKRSGAYGRIFVCGVSKERPGADTCVEAGIAVTSGATRKCQPLSYLKTAR